MTDDPVFTLDDADIDDRPDGDRPPDARPLEEQLLENGPALARLAAGMWWRAARWSMGASLRTGGRLARAAADPVLAAQVVNELGQELRTYARDLLGITELDQQVRQLMPSPNGAPANGSRNGASQRRQRSCASAAPCCCAPPPASTRTTAPIPPTRGS